MIDRIFIAGMLHCLIRLVNGLFGYRWKLHNSIISIAMVLRGNSTRLVYIAIIP